MRSFTSLIAIMFSMVTMGQTWIKGNGLTYISPDSSKVGIGTISPTEKLHITGGAVKIGNSTSATDRQKNLLKFGDGSFVQIGEWESDDMLSFKASKYNFTNGNVGINNSTPDQKLDVHGNIQTSGQIGYSIADKFSYQSSNIGNYSLQWHSDTWFSGGPTLWMSAYGGMKFFTEGLPRLSIRANGYVGIGTMNPQYMVDILGTIRAQEIFVNMDGADFVFDENYKLRSLNELSEYIYINKHLPDIQSATDMQTNGVSVSELQSQLLQKIEELTLYIIQQDNQIKMLQEKIENLENN